MRKNRLKNFLFTGILLISILFLTISLSSCTRSVNLYFASASETEFYLEKETREITVSDEFYKSVLEELIKGPKSSELYPTLPSNVKVNSVNVSSGTAAADFSSEIITNFEEIPHSSSTETLAIFSIVNTLTEFEEIEKVKITVEGKESGEIDGLHIEDFWGHMGIYEEFTRNEDIIKE